MIINQQSTLDFPMSTKNMRNKLDENIKFAADVTTPNSKVFRFVGQANGCILDQLEKVCEGEGAEMIAPNALENVWMCCHLADLFPCFPVGRKQQHDFCWLKFVLSYHSLIVFLL